MKINIRKANEMDYEAILGMIKELALFEKAPEKVTNTVAQMKEEKDFFQCYLAENEQGNVLGMALYYFAYYTWTGKALYLDDLYVKAPYRGHKVGTMLLRKIFNIAQKENCQRVRWQVLDWNHPAIEFYKKCGATIDYEWCNCDFERNQIVGFNL